MFGKNVQKGNVFRDSAYVAPSLFGEKTARSLALRPFPHCLAYGHTPCDNRRSWSNAMKNKTDLQSANDARMNVPGRVCVHRPIAGFTMVELLIVLSVVGILMTIVLPRIDVARFQLDAAIQEVASAVASARGQSILRQHDYVLMFAEDADRFFVLNDMNNNGQTTRARSVGWFSSPSE